MLKDIKSAVLESKDGLDADQWIRMRSNSKKTLLFLTASWCLVLFLILGGFTENNRLSFLSMPVLLIVIPVLVVTFVIIYRTSNREVARRVSENIDISEKTRGR